MLSAGATALGAAIGTFIFPVVGTVIGAFIGAVVGILASILADKGIVAIADKFVNEEKEFEVLEKSQMYEKALIRLGLTKTSTNEQATRARRFKWSVHHPDQH